MLETIPLLSLLIWLPILAGVLILAGPGERLPAWSRRIALLSSLVTLGLAVALIPAFRTDTHLLQLVERYNWVEQVNIQYFLGIDGISLPLILLTSLILPLVVIASWRSVSDRQAKYLATFAIMTGLMNGVFAAQDAILFYVFWEAMLIPMFLIIGIWGGPNRIYATLKFFLFTFFGSVFMLVALIYLGVQAQSFGIPAIQDLPLSMAAQKWIFVAFLLAFAVKIPMWPVHTWLPDAHVEAPTAGSVVLAALMLKMGGYGFLRFSLPITPDAANELTGLMIALSLIAIVYIGFVALAQQDMKKLIAYSSIAHMGFVTLGIFVVYQLATGQGDSALLGMQGAMVQMISHGLISAAMFLCVGVLYDRMHSRQIADYGGVVNSMPKFATLMMLFVMANAGLPGTSGFIGEFFVILSSFQASFWYALAAGMTLVLGAGYSLWLYKRVIFGPIANDRVAKLSDVNNLEMLVLGLLAIGVLGLGLYPQPLLNIMEPTLQHLIECGIQSKLDGGSLCQ